jgi:Fe2+ or Zn2+ uptake regulation protein
VTGTHEAISAEMHVFFLDYLEQKKLKLTPHRELILENFVENEAPGQVSIGLSAKKTLASVIRRSTGQ